jgi:hypothetical protein
LLYRSQKERNQEGGYISMMRRIAAISVMVMVGSLAGSVYAAGGVLEKDHANENYCHMKFPAIRPRTLADKNPQLKRSTTGDVIDFYGPCEEAPAGNDQITEQKHEEAFRFGRDYEDGD